MTQHNSKQNLKPATKWSPALEAAWRGYCDAALDFPFDYAFCDSVGQITASNYESGRLIVLQMQAWGQPLPPMGKKNVATLTNALNTVTNRIRYLGEASCFANNSFAKGK